MKKEKNNEYYLLSFNSCFRIEEATGRVGIQDKIYDVLGFCTKKQKVMPGLLAEATSGEIKVKHIFLKTIFLQFPLRLFEAKYTEVSLINIHGHQFLWIY